MLEKYLELLEHNLNWVKRQIREDERMKDLRKERVFAYKLAIAVLMLIVVGVVGNAILVGGIVK